MSKEIVIQAVKPKGAVVFLEPFKIEFVYTVADSSGMELAVTPLAPSPMDVTADVSPAQKAIIENFLAALGVKVAQKLGI